MNLYEIDREIEACLVIDEATGEVTFDEERLAGLQVERDRKIENLALYIKNLVAEASAIKAEKLVLAERQRRAEAKVERLRGYLSDALAGEKFSTPRVTVSWRKSERLEINEDLFIGMAGNEKYFVPEVKIDRAAVKADLKAGTFIVGAELAECQNIQIR